MRAQINYSQVYSRPYVGQMLLISSYQKVVYVYVEGTGWRLKGHLLDLCESVVCICVLFK